MLEFTNHAGEKTAYLHVNPGGGGLPFIGLAFAGPANILVYLDTHPGTADDLRQLAADLDQAWQNHEARTYAAEARPPEFLPDDCAEDARFLGQVPGEL